MQLLYKILNQNVWAFFILGHPTEGMSYWDVYVHVFIPIQIADAHFCSFFCTQSYTFSIHLIMVARSQENLGVGIIFGTRIEYFFRC